MKDIIGQDKQKWLVIIFVIIFIVAVVAYFVIGPARIKSILKGAFEPLLFWVEKTEPIENIQVKSKLKGMGSIYVKNYGQVPDNGVKYYTGFGGKAKTIFRDDSIFYVYGGERLKYFVVGGDLGNPIGEDKTEEKYIYERGDFKSDHIEVYKKIVYKNVYPGVNLEFTSNELGEKSTFVVDPNADYTKIATRLENKNLKLIDYLDDGRLEYEMNGTKLYDEAPICFQLDDDGSKQDVVCKYLLDNKEEVSFRLYEYDKTRTLYIDPTRTGAIIAASGATVNEYGNDIAVNTSNGDYYLVGNTYDATNFVGGVEFDEGGSVGSLDAFLVKFDSAGVKQWTFIAGASAVSTERGSAVAWINDGGEAIYFAGYTSDGANFTAGRTHDGTYGANDGYIVKIDENGSRQWSYIADSIAGGNEYVNDIIVNPNNNSVLATGKAEGSNFTGGGITDTCGTAIWSDEMFILDLNYNGTKDWVSIASGIILAFDSGEAIDYDSGNNVYVSGISSGDFCNDAPVRITEGTAWSDSKAVVVKLDSGGSIQRAFVGYSSVGNDDVAKGISIDRANGDIVYVTGFTEDATNFCNASNRVTQGTLGQKDVFILQLDSNFARQRTFLGGSIASQDDEAFDIKVDSNGDFVIVGYTNSGGSFGGSTARTEEGTLGSSDIFAMKVDWTFTDVWTYIGGSSDGVTEWANGIALNSTDEYYIAGFTNDSANFCDSGGTQDLYGTAGVADAFVLVLEDIILGAATVVTNFESSLGSAGAMLNGNITNTGGGFVEERGFEYGLTTSYTGSTTEVGSFGTGAYFQPLTGLDPNTTYHYRAYVINASGVYFGGDISFTTLPYRDVFMNAVGTAGSEVISSMAPTSDGGYLQAGTTNSYGNATKPIPIISKYDGGGYLQWSRTLDGLGITEIEDITALGGGNGYMVTGSSYSVTTGKQMLLIKLDFYGYTEWSKTIGD